MKYILETLIKVAYDLDRQEKYSEADKIESAIKELQRRVGLDIVDDMVSLADSLDQCGDTKNAELLDSAIQKLSNFKKNAICPQCGNDEYIGGIVCDDCGYPYVKEHRAPEIKTKKTLKTCRMCGEGEVGFDGLCDKCSPIADIGWGGEEIEHEAHTELLNNLNKIANEMDNRKLYKEADELDKIISNAASAVKPPKPWFDKVKKDTKKQYPTYGDDRIDEIVGGIWHKMSDSARNKVWKDLGRKGSPNK